MSTDRPTWASRMSTPRPAKRDAATLQRQQLAREARARDAIDAASEALDLRRAEDEKTARLRELRLNKEAADRKAIPPPKRSRAKAT